MVHCKILDRINRIFRISVEYFQFPEETENTQSPSARKALKEEISHILCY